MTNPPQKFKSKYRISSTRLHDWDYGTPGYYFITICTQNRLRWFGEVNQDQMSLSAMGELVEHGLQKTAQIRPNISIDTCVIMPNHIHAIIVIGEHPAEYVETPRRGVSTQTHWKPGTLGTLGTIINQYKSICTKRIRALGCKGFGWQARFYDHIIRNEKSMENIRAYIIENPLKWTEDEYYSKI